MNPHKRLITYCANRQIISRSEIKTTGNTKQLLRGLILFDHVTLHSIRFREIPAFVADLGLESTTELFKSGIIAILPDFVQFVIPSQGENSPSTLGVHSIAQMTDLRQYSLPNYFADLHRTLSVPLQRSDKLEEAIRSALADEPQQYGTVAKAHTELEILENSHSLKTAIASRLKMVFRFAITANDFDLRIHAVRKGIYQIESNIGSLCHLSEEQVHDAIGLSMTALAHLNLRIEEMQTYSSISGFDSDDLAIFDSRTRFLVERQNAQVREAQFHRLVTLLDLPELPTAPERFDVDKFLKIRAGADCATFRDWLSESATWSDADIIERVKSFREAFSRHYQSSPGKLARFVVSTGIGAIPGAGLILGPAATALDSFLLEKVLKPSGAIAFIGSAYPSLFHD